MTDSELDVIASALFLRSVEDHRDLWAAYDDDLIPECHRLVDAGYLERRVRNGDLVYRATDAAVTAQAMSDITETAAANAN